MSEFLTLHHLGFSSPDHLWALLVIPVLLVFTVVVRHHRRSRYTVLFTNLDTLAGVVAKRRTRLRRRMPLIFLALALATSAAAFARPHVQLTASGRTATVILLVDVSGSMEAHDIRPYRLAAAVSAMKDFLAARPSNDKVGLVTFSDKVDVLAVPTTDHTAVDSELDVLTPQGGTALGDGVEAAVKILVTDLAAEGVRHKPGEFLPATILLESDGAQNRGNATPVGAAELARAAGIRIYGVALGKRRGFITQGTGYQMLKIPVPSDPDVVGLLARVSGGRAFTATNAGSLDTIYSNLGSSIGNRPQRTEITSWFELGAAILLIIGLVAARARGGALP